MLRPSVEPRVDRAEVLEGQGALRPSVEPRGDRAELLEGQGVKKEALKGLH